MDCDEARRKPIGEGCGRGGRLACGGVGGMTVGMGTGSDGVESLMLGRGRGARGLTGDTGLRSGDMMALAEMNDSSDEERGSSRSEMLPSCNVELRTCASKSALDRSRLDGKSSIGNRAGASSTSGTRALMIGRAACTGAPPAIRERGTFAARDTADTALVFCSNSLTSEFVGAVAASSNFAGLLPLP